MNEDQDAVSRIVDQFLARLRNEGKIPGRVIEGLARLARDGKLGDESAIERVIREGDENGQTEEA